MSDEYPKERRLTLAGAHTGTSNAERWVAVDGSTVLTSASAARAYWPAPVSTRIDAFYLRTVNDPGSTDVDLYVDGSSVKTVTVTSPGADTLAKFDFGGYVVAAGSKIGFSHDTTNIPGVTDWYVTGLESWGD